MRMAPRCRNRLDFMYVMCVVSRSEFVGYYVECEHLQVVNNIKL